LKFIQSHYEILVGKLTLSRIRAASVEDLLRRPAVKLETDLISEFVSGKRVLITGAGGSIGSELCRQVARFGPTQLLLVERAEYNLFSIHRELTRKSPDVDVVPLLCDITDRERIDSVFETHQPNVVFHAAAHKHVPMVEFNPG